MYLTDMRSESFIDFRYIQDHLTKVVNLISLKTKLAAEIDFNLMEIRVVDSSVNLKLYQST